jgi:hypothetical protein
MGGAQDQLDSQQPFQGLQAAADGRLGGIHLPRRGGERPGLYDTNIGAHQLNAIYTLLSFHFLLPIRATYNRFTTSPATAPAAFREK